MSRCLKQVVFTYVTMYVTLIIKIFSVYLGMGYSLLRRSFFDLLSAQVRGQIAFESFPALTINCKYTFLLFIFLSDKNIPFFELILLKRLLRFCYDMEKKHIVFTFSASLVHLSDFTVLWFRNLYKLVSIIFAKFCFSQVYLVRHAPHFHQIHGQSSIPLRKDY